jgi:hypothetical protein
MDDDATTVRVGVELRAEAVDDGERAEAGRETRIQAMRAQARGVVGALLGVPGA